MPPTGNSHHRNAANRRSLGVAILLGCSLILSACGNDDGTDTGPQFVTDIHPTATATQMVATPTVTATKVVEDESSRDPSHVVSTRSAPRFVYLVIDGALTSYDSTNRAFKKLDIPADLDVIDSASSPTGDRLGVVAMLDNRLVVQFFGADGDVLTEAILLSVPAMPTVEASAMATPGATPTAAPQIPDRANQMHIDWIPQGDAVVVSGPGVNQRVSMSGVVMPIPRTGVSGTIVKSVWSPMDMQVAIQTQLQNGDQSIYMLDTGHDEARLLEAFEDVHGLSLSNLQWMPNGLGLIAVMGKLDGDVVMNGQIYAYRFDAEEPTLIATSGQGGPNSTITHAVISPDGHSIVYAVMVRDLGTWHLHSLWVRSLKGGPAVSIPTDSSAPITSLHWTQEGIVWQQADGTLMVVDNSLSPRQLGTEPIATPVVVEDATPVDDLAPVG